jgi:RNA polymerase sigma-70 factor (ECF subfamily)
MNLQSFAMKRVLLMMNSNDITLLGSRSKSGDKEAITEFFQQFHSDVFRVALSILDDPAEADDAAQVSLLRALKKLHSYRCESKLIHWIYSITLNECRARLRRRHGRERLLHSLFHANNAHNPAENHPEEQAIRNERQDAVWRAIMSLPENLRLTITLRYYHELPIGEVAEILKVSERTVHNRMRAAHGRLQIALDEKVVKDERDLT